MNKKIIEEIRSFNRYYTNILGLLEKHLLRSKYTLVEARIMFEINHYGRITSSNLIHLLNLDKGYLSRVLKKLDESGVINKITSKRDRRQTYIELSKVGVEEFKKLNQASNVQIVLIIKMLGKNELIELISHMKAIKEILSRTKDIGQKYEVLKKEI